MSGKPTLETVAREAGVSIPTVSQVMRGTGRISADTREKVLSAARSLHYVPNSRAAAMRSGDNYEVGIVINQLRNPFNAEVVSGAVDLLEAEGFLVSIVDTRDNSERQAGQLEAFIRHGRGGLLWVPAVDTPKQTFDLLKAQKIPAVTFLRRPNVDLDHVGIKDAEATATATRHLIELGHKAIAYLGGTEITHVRKERIAGYMSELEKLVPSATHLIWDCEDSKSAGLEAMLALHRKHPEMTGVVCNGDMVALGASLAISRMKLTPGHDISIVGFDDIEDASVAIPALTTMAVRPHKLGQKLAEVLLDRIRNPKMPPKVLLISAELMVRETTGTPRSSKR